MSFNVWLEIYINRKKGKCVVNLKMHSFCSLNAFKLDLNLLLMPQRRFQSFHGEILKNLVWRVGGLVNSGGDWHRGWGAVASQTGADRLGYKSVWDSSFQNTQCILKGGKDGGGLRRGSHKNQGGRFCGRKGGRWRSKEELPLRSGHDIPAKDRRGEKLLS